MNNLTKNKFMLDRIADLDPSKIKDLDKLKGFVNYFLNAIHKADFDYKKVIPEDNVILKYYIQQINKAIALHLSKECRKIIKLGNKLLVERSKERGRYTLTLLDKNLKKTDFSIVIILTNTVYDSKTGKDPVLRTISVQSTIPSAYNDSQGERVFKKLINDLTERLLVKRLNTTYTKIETLFNVLLCCENKILQSLLFR